MSDSLKYGDMILTVELITPERAAALLLQNGSNRNLRDRVVASYARDMAAGKWANKPLAICFKGEELGNGQHTLSAIVRSGKSQECLVARNVSLDAIAAMDQGVTRTITDVARILGEDFSQRRVSITRAMAVGPDTSQRITFAEMFDLYTKHEDAIEFVVQHLPQRITGLTSTVVGVVARAYYTVDRERLVTFCRVLVDGELRTGPKDRAAKLLRDWLMKRATRTGYAGRYTTTSQVAGFITAFMRGSVSERNAKPVDVFEAFPIPGGRRRPINRLSKTKPSTAKSVQNHAAV